jgi:hypothetical protein
MDATLIEIWLAHSSDSGKTWSKPRRVNDDQTRWLSPGVANGPDDVMPTLAVNKDGVVGIMWYHRRDHADNVSWTARFSASLDGGESWLPSVKVSEMPYVPTRSEPMPLHGIKSRWNPDEQILGVAATIYSGAHTAGLAADASGAFHPLWAGNSTGIPQMWTATVTIDGVVQRNGTAELAALKDVSDKVEYRYTNRRYTRATQTVEADVELFNASKDTIRGPLALRVLSVSSELGVPQLDNPDQPRRRSDLHFTPLLDQGVLAIASPLG